MDKIIKILGFIIILLVYGIMMCMFGVIMIEWSMGIYSRLAWNWHIAGECFLFISMCAFSIKFVIVTIGKEVKDIYDIIAK